MGISQQTIADALGLSRTTVTKILNRDPKYSASESTRDIVFKTAEKLGYDFSTIRRPFKREYGRTEVNTEVIIEILSDADQSVFDRGQATARNVGIGGALLTNMRLPKNCLPLSKFTIKCRFTGIPLLADLVGECQVVRITDSMEGDPELGVRFINATTNDRRIIKEFVTAAATVQLAARAAAMNNAVNPLPPVPPVS
jgi:transcriptional regulator with XRE-family HTH domain